MSSGSPPQACLPPEASPPLQVFLDVSAVPPHPAGAGQYTLALARELVASGEVHPALVCRRGDTERWQSLVTPGADPGGLVLPAAPDSRLARLVWEQTGLPRLLRRQSPQLHHSPHYTMPRRSPVPAVVTVHDCTFFDHPEWHERSKALYFRQAIRHAARAAAALVCVSQATAEHLWQLCKVRARVFVAPHGVDRMRFSPDEPEHGADVHALGGLGVDTTKPFIAFVGTIEPRKGVAVLVRAFARIAHERPELRLVLAGHEGWGVQEVRQALEHHGVADRVQRLGYVPDGAVPALLRRAAAVAYPSFAEGYGLPALEALACGAPLVTTEGTAMAEVTDGAALLVPAGDERSLADALEQLIEEPAGVAAERRRKGAAAATRHSWQASASRHLEAYRYAAGMAR